MAASLSTRRKSDVKHAPSQIGVNPISPQLLCLIKYTLLVQVLVTPPSSARRSVISTSDKQLVDIAPGSLASQIRIISSGDKADGFRGTDVEVRSRVRALLDRVRIELILVVDDCVMRRPNLALQTRVCLEVKVEVVDGRDSFVNHSTRDSVSVLRRVCFFGWVESSVVSFSAYHDAKLGTIRFASDVQLCEGVENLRQFML